MERSERIRAVLDGAEVKASAVRRNFIKFWWRWRRKLRSWREISEAATTDYIGEEVRVRKGGGGGGEARDAAVAGAAG